MYHAAFKLFLRALDCILAYLDICEIRKPLSFCCKLDNNFFVCLFSILFKKANKQQTKNPTRHIESIICYFCYSLPNLPLLIKQWDIATLLFMLT